MADARTTMNGTAMVITSAGTLSAYASITLQNVKGDQNFEIEEVKDYAGFDQSWLARNEYVELTCSIKLSGTGKAAAIANGVFLLPLSGVTLAGFDLPWINVTGVAGAYTGEWQYRSGSSLDLNNDKVGGMEIKLRKYANAAQNTLATTAATA